MTVDIRQPVDVELAQRGIIRALQRATSLQLEGKLKNEKEMVVILMNEPSYVKRFLLVDIESQTILRRHHVAHGVGSSCRNKAYACKFSNIFGSRQSSLGAFLTGSTYYGKHGYSLNLHGQDTTNNLAYKRRVVIHKARYVTDGYIKRNGRAGQSWGCPALDPAIYKEIINRITDGTLVYIHYEEQ